MNLVNFVYRNIVGEKDDHHTTQDKLLYIDQAIWITKGIVAKNESDAHILDNVLQKEHVREKLQKYMDAYNDSMMSGGPTDELNELVSGLNHDRIVILNRISNMIDQFDE